MRKFISCVCLLLCALCLTGMTAGATVSVQYLGQGDVPISDVEVRLYRVGDIENETIVWSDEYADYNLSVDEVTGLQLASTLRSYVLRDEKVATFNMKTNEYGQVRFEQVAPGCYLMDGDEKVTDDGTYYVVPSLVYVQDESLVNVDVKHEFVPAEVEKVSKTVKKVWEKNESTPIIKADLLKDGELYDSQILDDVRDWTYTWDDLDGNAMWTIVEHEVPDGYTLTVSIDGDTTVLTNRGTYEPPVETPSPEPSPTPDPEFPPVENPPEDPPKQNPNEPMKVNPETGVESDAFILGGLLGLFVLVAIGGGYAASKIKS